MAVSFALSARLCEQCLHRHSKIGFWCQQWVRKRGNTQALGVPPLQKVHHSRHWSPMRGTASERIRRELNDRFIYCITICITSQNLIITVRWEPELLVFISAINPIIDCHYTIDFFISHFSFRGFYFNKTKATNICVPFVSIFSVDVEYSALKRDHRILAVLTSHRYFRLDCTSLHMEMRFTI